MKAGKQLILDATGMKSSDFRKVKKLVKTLMAVDLVEAAEPRCWKLADTYYMCEKDWNILRGIYDAAGVLAGAIWYTADDTEE